MVGKLTQRSLLQSPVARLKSASQNPHYIGRDLVDPDSFDVYDSLSHHWAVTPVHEAGHAVAMIVVGDVVKDVSFVRHKAFGDDPTAYGRVRIESRLVGDGYLPPGAGSVEGYITQLGADGVYRQFVGIFGGPVADLRYDCRMAYSHMYGDRQAASVLLRAAQEHGIADAVSIMCEGWETACEMFQDENIWAATLVIAARLKASHAAAPRVTGRVAASIVQRCLPRGWRAAVL